MLETLEAGIVIKDEQQADEAMDIDSDDDDMSEKASLSKKRNQRDPYFEIGFVQR